MSETIISQVKKVIMEKEGSLVTLDDLQVALPHLNRRQLRSSAGNARRDYSGFYRVGDAVFIYSKMKLREHYDGRSQCVSCGQTTAKADAHATEEKDNGDD